jgi:hypothetical protein
MSDIVIGAISGAAYQEKPDGPRKNSQRIADVPTAAILLLLGLAQLLMSGCSKPDKYIHFYEGDKRPLKEMALVLSDLYGNISINEIDGKNVVYEFQFFGGVLGGNQYLVLEPGEHLFTASYSSTELNPFIGYCNPVEGGPLQKPVQLRKGYLYSPYPIVRSGNVWTYGFAEVDLNTCMQDDHIRWLTLYKELRKQRKKNIPAVLEGPHENEKTAPFQRPQR